MDTELYKAAMEGNLDQVLLQQKKDELGAQVTPNKNSVLHVAALFNKSDVVKEILTAQPLLLRRVNNKGDTALHIAAKEGHYSTVQALIECAEEDDSEVEIGIGMAKYLLRMVNNDGHTALHEAVWNKKHLNIVKLLVKADREFSHPANNAEETPLYIAAERGFEDIVSKILDTCTSPGCSGPEDRNALHGAVVGGSEGCMRKLVEWRQSLIKEADVHGWTPLHYIARLTHDSLRAGILLDADKSVAYCIAQEDNNMTALHVAAIWGNIYVMEMLILRFPDCWEMVDSKGQNILHLASRHLQWRVIDFILKDSKLSSLINQKDDDGNTPLHLLVSSDLDISAYLVPVKWASDMINDPRVDKRACSKDKLTPYDIACEKKILGGVIQQELFKAGAYQSFRNLNEFLHDDLITQKRKPLPEDVRKIGDTQLIVAAFIATVTFAASFTAPGGYDDKGMAVLIRSAAFKAFVISNTVAMVLSTYSVFILLLCAFYRETDEIFERLNLARKFIFLALGAMMLAFMTGMYAVLVQSLGLAIFVCLIVGLASSLLLYFGLRRTTFGYLLHFLYFFLIRRFFRFLKY